jgi:hypothetical protein
MKREEVQSWLSNTGSSSDKRQYPEQRFAKEAE